MAGFDGYCDTTEVHDAKACFRAERGAFPNIQFDSTTTWEAAIAICRHRCLRCARCRFISVSLKWSDCSWFRSCALDRLRNDVVGHKSMRVVRDHAVLRPIASIPRVLIQTSHLQTQHIPTARLHSNFTRGLKWRLFDDADVREYLAHEPMVEEALRKLDAPEVGLHRADLFRYFVLWREGGIYADIKTRFTSGLARWLRTRSHVPTVFMVKGDVAACPESGVHIYNGFIASPPRSPVMRALLDDMVDAVLTGKDPSPLCDGGRCGARDHTYYLRLAWQRLVLLYPSLAADTLPANGTHENEGSRLVLLEERCFTWRKEFAFQPAECRGFGATDRYGRCCNAYLRDGSAAQRVEGGGTCGGGRKVFVVRDPRYTRSGFGGTKVDKAPLPVTGLMRSGAALCGSCRGADPEMNDRPLISGEQPLAGVRYSTNAPACEACGSVDVCAAAGD